MDFIMSGAVFGYIFPAVSGIAHSLFKRLNTSTMAPHLIGLLATVIVSFLAL